MYVGRIVAAGITKNDQLVAMYRVSSRSFPDRQVVRMGDILAVVPRDEYKKEVELNPYITYNCLRYNCEFCVVANGVQSDFIFEKLAGGMPARDALMSVLCGLDYEHDELKTPRISAVVDRNNRTVTFGIIRHDALLVRTFTLQAGVIFYLATYNHDYPDEKFQDNNFDVKSAEEACDYILGEGIFASLELPVSAASAYEKATGFEIAFKNLALSHDSDGSQHG
jgi:IMP cyclohydrolase